MVDANWLLTQPERIWGKNGDQLAKDMISWRDNVVISLKDWMDPTKLATLNHKGIENYGWKFNNSAAMYVLSPVEAARLGVFTYTDNLTFKITKRNRHPLYQKEASIIYTRSLSFLLNYNRCMWY